VAASRERVPCPACGAPIAAEAISCRVCGADEATGWATEGEAYDEETAQELDLPRDMDDEDYEAFLREELGGEAPRTTPFSRWGLFLAVLAALAVAALLALLVHGVPR
jgi:hypothetical protein